MKILALDLSSTNIGWCTGNTYNVIDHNTITPHGKHVQDRLVGLDNALAQLIELQKPEVIAYESQAGLTHSIISHSYVIGFMLVRAARAGIPTIAVPPSSAKKALTGSGKASKSDMIMIAKQKYNLSECTEHEADALGVLVYVWQHHCQEGIFQL